MCEPVGLAGYRIKNGMKLIFRKAKRPGGGAGTGKMDATVWRWSIRLGLKYETLKRKLIRAQVEWEPYKKVPAKDIFRAFEKTRLQAAQARLAAARAALAERKLEQFERNWTPRADVEKAFTDVLRPVRERMLALPAEMAEKCNPANPEQARPALDDWVGGFLPLISEEKIKTAFARTCR